jgi:uncharacterized protein with HEPN domain
MLGATEAAIEFVGDMGNEVFLADTRTVYAVRAAFITLGEAAGHIPDGIRQSHPDIPWREIRHFRNFMVHVYPQVDPGHLHRTVVENLPALRDQLTTLLAQLPAT